MKKPKYRKIPRTPAVGSFVAWIGTCVPCEKHLYHTRDDARQVGRRHQPRKNAYECPHNPGLWHVGSLSKAVKAGARTRDEVYG